ncbi:MAG TPA: hypothetical protein GX391_06180 [Firmicutes bacterium]|jgi:archaellum component FlaC|nr:hypothetical protein [Bacillota bacterium]HOQ24894.1 hypothetical protein [Bacillota bacterium]HPT68382.1 hypothetical protein [Bacillota bacterium]
MVEQVLGQILERLTSLEGTFKADMSGLKGDVSELKSDVTGLKSDVARIDYKLNVVVEQTAGLLEFKTEMIKKTEQLVQDNVAIKQILGEHEIAIRAMQRRFFND